eukprot:15245577-Alexandrium_andersonii.AAC.1
MTHGAHAQPLGWGAITCARALMKCIEDTPHAVTRGLVTMSTNMQCQHSCGHPWSWCQHSC